MNARTSALCLDSQAILHPKVMLVCLHADPTMAPGVGEGGGTHRYLRELLGLLAQAGVPHFLVTRRTSPDLPPMEQVSPWGNLIRLDIGPTGKIDKRLLDDHHQTTVRCMEEVIERYGAPDLLHSIYWNSGRASMEVAERLGISFIHTVISNGRRRLLAGYDDQPAQRPDIEGRVFRSAARVFCICGQERDDLMAFYDVHSTRISVVGRPVPAPFKWPCRDRYGQPRPIPAGIGEGGAR